MAAAAASAANTDILSSSVPSPFFVSDLSTACPPVDPLFYDSLQPPFLPESTLPEFSDYDYNNFTGCPELVDNIATSIDWNALGCLPGSSELGGSPNIFDSSSGESPDPLPDQTLSTATTAATSSMPATTSLPTPSPTSQDHSPKENPSRVSKRQLNTLAARRYRQRRVDRMNQLEAELEAVKRERDELKMRVSKLEGETQALRSMVQEKSK